MSKLFYDHLLELEKLSNRINQICETEEERVELWYIVDEIIHHRVLMCVLDYLPREHHELFVERFKNEPYNEELIFFVNDKAGESIEGRIRERIIKLQEELLTELIG